MIESILRKSKTNNQSILIVGAPRSGTHALAALLHQHDPSLRYYGEIGKIEKTPTPWADLIEFSKPEKQRKLAHVVQLYTKIFAAPFAKVISDNNLVIELRRRDKLTQFASWFYFKHIGSIYNFDHKGIDYIPPRSLEVTIHDIEQFILAQTVDAYFNPVNVLYYEDLDLSTSRVKRNEYSYPIIDVISNIDLVKEYLSNWEYI